jgi:hypothetical protein
MTMANHPTSVCRHGLTMPQLGDWSEVRIQRQYRAESIKLLAVDYLRGLDDKKLITITDVAKAIGHVTQRVALVIMANRMTFQTWKQTRSDSTTLVRLHPDLRRQVIA